MWAFPISHWTELDVWRHVEREGLDVVWQYFSGPRPVVERNGILVMCDSVDDGKPTLLSWLLAETRSLPTDVVDAARQVWRCSWSMPSEVRQCRSIGS